MLLAMFCSSIVLPVRGGATIRPRWPLPIGVIRSITRADRFSRVGLELDAAPAGRAASGSRRRSSRLRLLRRLEVDRLDLDQREVALAVLRRPDLARTPCRRCAGRTCGSARARRRCRRGRAGSCSRGRAGSRSRRAASRARLRRRCSPLFSARDAQDLEDQLLLAHAGGAGHVELLGDLGQRGDAHVLQRRRARRLARSAASARRRRPSAAGAVGALAVRRVAVGARSAGGCGYAAVRLAVLRSVFHSSSSPSPVSAETGSTGMSNTDSSSSSMARALGARQLVDLRRHDDRVGARPRRSHVPRVQIRFEARMPRVHEQQRRARP